MSKSWMIYGANGYTGALMAREAMARGLTPILAGRKRERIEPLAQELGLEYRVFDLANAGEVAAGLAGVGVVLHCAGPFSATAEPMMQACMKSGAHYLDIAGEIAVFERAHALHAQAQKAGVVLCPGVGFDVVPTDCVAAALKAALPDATHLALGFDTSSSLSPGTAKTVIEGMEFGGQARQGGEIVSVPQAWHTREIDFGRGEKHAMTIPWGDVSTAYQSTGIPNIEVYVPVPRSFVMMAKAGNYMGWLWRREAVKNGLKRLVDKFVEGPDADRRASQPTYVWGEVVNAAGQKKTARVTVASVYEFTLLGALGIVEYLLAAAPEGGSYTPSRLMGHEYVTRLPGSGPLQVA